MFTWATKSEFSWSHTLTKLVWGCSCCHMTPPINRAVIWEDCIRGLILITFLTLCTFLAVHTSPTRTRQLNSHHPQAPGGGRHTHDGVPPGAPKGSSAPSSLRHDASHLVIGGPGSSTVPGHYPNRMSWLKIMLRIREVAGSKLRPEIGYHGWGFLWSFSLPPGELRDSTLKLANYRFLPNPFQVITRSLDAI
jgi:hypothetical protein